MQKVKRAYNKGLQKKKNFLLTKQISDLIEDTAKRLGMSETELVATCVFDILSDRSRFINCPACKKPVMYKALLQVSEGIPEFDCICGTHIWYDAENDLIVKQKAIQK